MQLKRLVLAIYIIFDLDILYKLDYFHSFGLIMEVLHGAKKRCSRVRS